jgi:hypothetical protein
MLLPTPALQQSGSSRPGGTSLLRELGPKLVLGTVVAVFVEMAVRDGILVALGVSPVLAFFMTGSFAIHMWTRPGRRETLMALAAALALGWISTATWLGEKASPLVTCGSFLGVGSLTSLLLRAMLTQGKERGAKLATFGAACVQPLLWIVTAYSVKLTTTLYPSTYDAYLLGFDASLGFHPSFLAGQWFQTWPALASVSALVYLALPFGVSMLYGWARVSGRLPVRVLPLFLTTSLLGFQLYYFVPATGPLYAFESAFPWNPPDMAGFAFTMLQLPATPPRNAMPSLHAAAAMLVVFNSILWPRWAKILSGFFLFFTLLATMGLGEHYFVDLVVALPLSLALQAAWTHSVSWRAPERRNALILGVGLTCLWLAFLRVGAPVYNQSLAVGWGAVILTLIPCLIALRRLLRTMA